MVNRVVNGDRPWTGQLLSAAFAVLIAAIALYLAACLIKAAWLTLLFFVLAVVALVAGVGWYRRHTSGW